VKNPTRTFADNPSMTAAISRAAHPR